MNFKIVDGIVNWDDGSSRPASYEELIMWNRIERSESAYDSLHKDYIQAVQEVRIAHENHHESVEHLQNEVERLKTGLAIFGLIPAFVKMFTDIRNTQREKYKKMNHNHGDWLYYIGQCDGLSIMINDLNQLLAGTNISIDRYKTIQEEMQKEQAND